MLYEVITVQLNERHFRYQSYILAIMAFARSWATNMYLTGSFYGIPERYVTMVPMIAMFLAAALFCIRNVITSYSIHYTKLYEARRNAARAG